MLTAELVSSGAGGHTKSTTSTCTWPLGATLKRSNPELKVAKLFFRRPLEFKFKMRLFGFDSGPPSNLVRNGFAWENSEGAPQKGHWTFGAQHGLRAHRVPSVSALTPDPDSDPAMRCDAGCVIELATVQLDCDSPPLLSPGLIRIQRFDLRRTGLHGNTTTRRMECTMACTESVEAV
jgi:hypothetical protein